MSWRSIAFFAWLDQLRLWTVVRIVVGDHEPRSGNRDPTGPLARSGGSPGPSDPSLPPGCRAKRGPPGQEWRAVEGQEGQRTERWLVVLGTAIHRREVRRFVAVDRSPKRRAKLDTSCFSRRA